MPKAKCKICYKEFYLSERDFIEGIKEKKSLLCESCNQMKEKASDPKLILDCYFLLARRWHLILSLFEKKTPPRKIHKYIRNYWQFCRHYFYINFYESPSSRHVSLKCEICPIDKNICKTHYYYRWGGKVRHFQYIQKITKKEFYKPFARYQEVIIEILSLILENISKLISKNQFSLDKKDHQFLKDLYKKIKESDT